MIVERLIPCPNFPTSYTLIFHRFPQSQFTHLSHFYTTTLNPSTVPVNLGYMSLLTHHDAQNKCRVSWALDFQLLEVRVHVVLHCMRCLYEEAMSQPG
jgi:hypothetical protein